MNENEISRLMDQYREQLGSCSKVPAARKRPFLTWQRGTVALAASAVLVGAFVFLLPEDAAARALKRVGQAVKSMRSMQMTNNHFRNGKWTTLSRAYYQGAMWRQESFYNTPLECYFLKHGNQILTNYKALPHATLQDIAVFDEGWEVPEDMGVLEYAMEYATNYGNVSEEREISLKESPPYHGNPTYKIVMTRSNTNYRAEILVDGITQLPISSEYSFVDGAQSEQSKQTYTFDEDLPNELFSLDIGKPVVDLTKEQEKLGQQWARPLAEVGTTKVRDVSVTPDGTVWVAVSADSFGPRPMMPMSITTDAKSDYVRFGRDIDVSAVWGKKRARIGGQEVLVVGFIASDPEAELPKKVMVKFADRSSLTPGFSGSIGTTARSGPIYSFISRRESSRFPDYFVTLDLDHLCFQLWPQVNSVRGDFLGKQGKYMDAARSYELAAKGYEGFIKRLGAREMRLAAEFYVRAGRPDLAAKAHERSAELNGNRK
ncbi:MAG: hypothetical protein ACAH95_10845 [Fimbriimonas sp.]